MSPTPEDMIEVAVIDDDPAVLDSTRMVLAGEGFRVSTYASATAFLKALDRGLALDCIVSDVRMPEMTGLELQSTLLQRGSTIPLILITGHGEISMAVASLKAGASDFLEKPFEAAVLTAAIHKAAQQARQIEKTERLRTSVRERAELLSSRQREVMYLVAEGYSNKQIAAKLGISTRTVETYRLWVMEKMGAGSLAALVRMVMLLPEDDGKA